MGTFKPGQEKPTGSGRKRGSLNKKSQYLMDALSTGGLDVPQRLINLLPNLSNEKQADVLLNLMAYLYPKRKAIEHSFEEPEQKCIKIVFVESEYDKAQALEANRDLKSVRS